MNLIIDVGNTKAKLAVFKEEDIAHKIICNENEVEQHTKKLQEDFAVKNGILSSVTNVSKNLIESLKALDNILVVSHKTKIPFYNNYLTPATLGLDRIALMSAASQKYPNQNCLVIDAGTCITFDFLNDQNQYLGGAISPGLSMRYKALSVYTANLPDLKKLENPPLIGKDTHGSIHSGVVNGIVNEIDGTVNQYKKKYRDLTVILTGGDMKFLSKQLKNSIFANQNFLLLGLNSILNYNLPIDD